MTDTARALFAAGEHRRAFAEVLLDRAIWTHNRIGVSERLGVDLHEDTLTQTLLLDIAGALPGLSTRVFSRKEEARTGADWQWEWWFHGARWFGVRVQAKRLKRLTPATTGYDFRYMTGRGRHHRRQVDVLIADAALAKIPAIYALYNGPALDPAMFAWRCSMLPQSAAVFGVSVLDAARARDFADNAVSDYQVVSREARPWSCLLGCPGDCDFGRWWPEHDPFAWRILGFGEADRGDIALAAASAVLRLKDPQYFVRRRDFPRSVQPGIHDSPPAYLRALLDDDRESPAQFPRRVAHTVVFESAR